MPAIHSGSDRLIYLLTEEPLHRGLEVALNPKIRRKVSRAVLFYLREVEPSDDAALDTFTGDNALETRVVSHDYTAVEHAPVREVLRTPDIKLAAVVELAVDREVGELTVLVVEDVLAADGDEIRVEPLVRAVLPRRHARKRIPGLRIVRGLVVVCDGLAVVKHDKPPSHTRP